MTAPPSPTEPVCRVFVYGTLKRGECRERCWPHRPVRIAEATIPAALYDLGPYPAIGPGEDVVRGEVWELLPEQMETTLRELDEVEGYAQQPDDLYTRRLVTCRLDDGTEVTAWTYFYGNLEELNRARRVMPNGDGYCEWEARK